MAAEVAGLVLVPTPIFQFNSVQKPAFTAERPWFLIYCLLINNLTNGLLEVFNAFVKVIPKFYSCQANVEFTIVCFHGIYVIG